MERRRLRITGTVQGVGFRPFAHRLAGELRLTGAIGNDDHGVWCDIQGPGPTLDDFIRRLSIDAPPLARIDEVDVEAIAVVHGEGEFTITASSLGRGSATASVPPDIAPCGDCLEEIADPSDRRYGYAFTCCTDCGPRFTVVNALPYDRVRTSMAKFALCAACAGEFQNPADRRYHAQATCCPQCGPTLSLSIAGVEAEGDPLARASALLLDGAIVALKGVGGYQLVCRADDSDVVARLRARKYREEKPFALLVGSLFAAGKVVSLNQMATRALTSPEAPIVLAPRHETAPIAAEVAPKTQLLGVMLPATPVHALLTASVGDVPLVCTSGNRSDEPIVIDDARVELDLGSITDAVLWHDRRIERRADDSVGQVVAGDFQLLRRARGFAPRPVRLAAGGPTVLGVGAELKNTVCLALDANAHLSAHLGDLEHTAALAAFEAAVTDLLSMSRATPELVVHDLHPEYLSTKFAAAVDLAPTLAVQHHHAHLAACLADNGRAGPAIGVAFDGLGWGADDTLWGGEFLVGDATEYHRAAHLTPVPLPGGGIAIREPWRMAVAHLRDAYGPGLAPLPLLQRHDEALPTVQVQCRSVSSPATSSVGRLFDTVAALCGLGDTVSFEGQAAIRLEQAAGETHSRYPVVANPRTDAPMTIAPRQVVGEVVEDLLGGVPVPTIAGAFHRWVSDMIVCCCSAIRDECGLSLVALSGGVFQNRLLVELTVPALEAASFEVLRHRQTPPNDGGLALGQVVIGRAHLAANGAGI